MQGKTPESPELLYGSIVDYYAASMVAYGVASALYQREKSGEGQYVGVSLLRSALTLQSARMIWAENEPREVGRDMRSGGVTGIHPTKQGSLYISANTPHFWKDLCELPGLTELAADPRYDSVRKRAEHAAEIVPKLRAALAKRTALEWETIFGERVPCAAARSVEDMFDHPQVAAEGIIDTYEHPVVGRFRGIKDPIRFSGSKPAKPRSAPTFGGDSHPVLEGAGFSAEEIARLEKEGVVGANVGKEVNVDA
jgi:formyl-CoA transferase